MSLGAKWREGAQWQGVSPRFSRTAMEEGAVSQGCTSHPSCSAPVQCPFIPDRSFTGPLCPQHFAGAVGEGRESKTSFPPHGSSQLGEDFPGWRLMFYPDSALKENKIRQNANPWALYSTLQYSLVPSGPLGPRLPLLDLML